MQAFSTPYHDSVDHAYRSQKNTPPILQQSARQAPAPALSPSHFPTPEAEQTRFHLPRTSSLLPPPHIVPNLGDNSAPSSSRYSPVAEGQASTTTNHFGPSPFHHHEPDEARSSSRASAANSYFVNRWSASTGSSHSNTKAPSRATPSNRRTSSVDTTFLLTNSPPSAQRRSRKLQKNRRPSDNSEFFSSFATGSPERPEREHYQKPFQGLPTLEPLPSFAQDYSTAFASAESEQEGGSRSRTTTDASDSTRPPTSTAIPTAMPYDQGRESNGPINHARNRSGRSSSDSPQTRGPKHPSQKAMLSRALQKANAAVQLDNGQDVWGARQAYGEACELLQQVLQRTSAQEDKKKLEAIQRTYTSRIDELDQMLPSRNESRSQSKESKALPDFPDEHDSRRDTVFKNAMNELSSVEAATVAAISREDRYSPQPPTQSLNEQPSYEDPRSQRTRQQSQTSQTSSSFTPQLPEPGFLQSSFSKSPVRSRFPDNALQPPPRSHTTAHIASEQQTPVSNYSGSDMDGPVRSDFSMGAPPRNNNQRGLEHSREDSQNSWLDPIDESGGSTASSVHSRTSSLGYRRRHIRSGSGDTEAEFDTALDAAIEAAYDDGYEPMDAHDYVKQDPDEEIVANALRRVELARERVRQTEREAYEMANETERERFQLHNPQQQQEPIHNSEHFFDDNSSDEEERMLEEMTRDYSMQGFSGRGLPKQSSFPRESDSSGFTSRTWQSSIGSNPPGTGTTSLSTVTESAPVPPPPKGPAPTAPPPTHALPEIPSAPSSGSQSVRNRRMSGQNRKQLKIETMGLAPPPQMGGGRSAPLDDVRQGSHPLDESVDPLEAPRRPMSPSAEATSADTRLGSPFGHRDGEDHSYGRSASPSISKLKKNFSSSSLRSLKGRNMSMSQLDDPGDMSPGTPSSTHWGTSRTPAIPAIPSAVTANLREKGDASIGGMYLLDDSFHAPESPGSPNPAALEAPVSLEPCPTDFMLRPFWLMRCLYQTLVHPRGGYVSSKMFVPREAWKVKGVKLKNVEDKIANCDFLSAALLKLARVDTCDADAMLEEMQSMEGVLEQVQAALSRKLGNEVGVQSSGTMFKEASGGPDGDSTLPRSTSVSGKSSFSWRRLRSKNSAAALGAQGRTGTMDSTKDSTGLPTLPMTAQPTSKPARRDMSQTQFTGPNAHYMGSLARLFDAAQVIDQIARQVEDPGLRHADKTQVGLELCTRHAAEFFGFYICRFVLTDLGMMMDKFIKRGSEWVLT